MNRNEGDLGPRKWIPPNAEQHFQYVEDWAVVKQRCASEVSVQEGEAVVAIGTE